MAPETHYTKTSRVSGPRAAAPSSSYTGATPTNPVRATSSSTRTTILAWGLCVYDPPRRRAAPWQAGATAECFELFACSFAPPPRAAAPSSSYTGATPANPVRATSSSTRTTILAWGLCVYDPPRRRAAPWQAGATAECFELFACSFAPPPRAAAPSSSYTGATPANLVRATSSSTRTTKFTRGLCVCIA